MNTNPNPDPQMDQHVVNRDFARLVKQMRRVLPYLALGLLIVVYATCAATEGLFLSGLMAGIPFHLQLSLAIGSSIQMTRGLLVFFPQLNPNKPMIGYTGEIVAIIMGGISIVSITKLVLANDMNLAVATSLSILMAAGVGVEIYLLKEIKFYTDMELYLSKGWWNKTMSLFRARKDFKIFQDNLRDERQGSSATLPDPAAAGGSPALPDPQQVPAPQPNATSTPDANLDDQMTPEEQAEYNRMLEYLQRNPSATKLRQRLAEFDDTPTLPLGNGSGARRVELSLNGHSRNGTND
jgi:hypothetical protein